jgi:hypothetical protein
MPRTFDIKEEDNINFNINICDLSKSENIEIIKKNPHCLEYFCKKNNIHNCNKCINYLLEKKKIKLLYNKYSYKNDSENIDYCLKNCTNGYKYDNIEINKKETLDSNNIDRYKKLKKFKKKKLPILLDEVKYKLDYEDNNSKPRTVIHWGQLKMLLITIIFFINVLKETDYEVHIIYPGSARGDDILILCEMFPNTIWHLIDPHEHHPKLHNHNQVKEIISDFFTDSTAKYFYEKFKNRDYKLLFMSDIRKATDDESVLNDQEENINWHKIIKPDFSFFKFRCGYETNEIYKYYKGLIFLQPYAPQSSTETRLLLNKELEVYDYNINEYQGKLYYFNRVLRPSYYKKSIINESNYFDHCYDCTYFSYLIKNYLNNFSKFNPFNSTNVFDIMKKITNKISKYTNNKIAFMNSYIKNNMN